MKTLIALLLLCVPAITQPTEVVVHGERLPVYSGGVHVPHGSVIELSGECDVGNLVNDGVVIVRQGALVDFSNIICLPGSYLYLGVTSDNPISCELRHNPVPYREDDPTKRGNSIIVIDATVEFYGKHEFHDDGVLEPGEPMPPTWNPYDHVEEHKGWRVNFARSIRLTRADPDHPIRPHFMVMHSSQPAIFQGVEADGWGLSRKDIPLHETDNPRAGYAFPHAHRCGEDNQIIVRDCSSRGSPGVAFANHSSNVLFQRCVASAHGCAFFMEAGDEIGSFEDCFAINVLSDLDSMSYAPLRPEGISMNRQHNDANGALGDFGGGGEGMWCQSPRVRVKDFTAINCRTGVFCFFKQLPEIADGSLTPDGDVVPNAKTFDDGTPIGHAVPVDWEGLTLIDSRVRGFHTRWATKPRSLGRVVVNGIGHGPKGVGMIREYDAGFVVEGGEITGDAAAAVDLANGTFTESTVVIRNCLMSGFRTGVDHSGDAVTGLVIKDCDIEATEVGIRRVPVTNHRFGNATAVTNTAINAPVEIELVPGKEGVDYSRADNSFAVDGEPMDWPGLEDEG